MTISRRRFTQGILAAAAAPTAARAQSYPAKPINIVVGYSAGGGVDAVVRTIATPLGARLGQPIVVENRPGASGVIAASHAAKAPPDGYTLFGTDGGAIALNAALFSKLPYDPVADFAPVSLIIRAPLLIVAHPMFPASDLKGLVEYAKREKGGLYYASAGLGTYHHLGMELLKSRAGFEAQGVQYKGAGPAVQEVMGGQVPVMPLDTIVALPLLRAGKIKAIAALTPTRLDSLPDVPTAAETGLRDVEVYPWVGLVAPRATPASLVARLGAEVREVVTSSEVAKRFTNLGMEPHPLAPEQFGAFIRGEIARWHPLIKRLDIKLD